jgi:thymidylate synthase ThyX
MGLDQIKAELCSSWGGDRDAANAAWASSTDLERALARGDEDVRRVVTGIIHHHHDTPKERLWMEFFITCPIFVERQFDKYRMTQQYQNFQIEYDFAPFGRDGITQNELSGRYRTIPDRSYTLPEDVKEIAAKVSGDKLPNMASEIAGWNSLLRGQHEQYQAALARVKRAAEHGHISNAEYKRAREVLRGILGTAFLTDMRIVMNMNAFEHIINQRLAREAQLESRVLAARLLDAVISADTAPVMVSEMIHANGWDGLLVDFSGT